MRSSIKLFVAASVAVAALGIGCQHVPEKDVAGGILAGNDFSSQQAARGTSLDHSIVGTGGGSSIDASHASAGPTGSAGTVTSGGGASKAVNSPAAVNAAVAPAAGATIAPAGSPGSGGTSGTPVSTPNNPPAGAAPAGGAPAAT